MIIEFDSTKHQKVRHAENGTLYVVLLDEYPNFYTMNDDDSVVVHIVNKDDLITHNEHENVRKLFRQKKGDLSMQGGLVKE